MDRRTYFRSEMRALIGKYEITFQEIIEDYGRAIALIAVESHYPEDLMKKFVDIIMAEIERLNSLPERDQW